MRKSRRCSEQRHGQDTHTTQRTDRTAHTNSTLVFLFSSSGVGFPVVSVSLRLFTPCLLESGNKSYSHMIALLDRYKTVFQVMSSTTFKKRAAGAAGEPEEPPTLLSPFDCQRLILHSLSEYWQHSSQHLIVLTDQMYTHGIISMQSVVAWVFFSSRHPERQTHLWHDILFALLRRALDKLQKDVDSVLHKPRAMSITAERRAEDERHIEAILLERRELLVSCVANFQRLLSEVQKREVAKDKERLRMEQDMSALVQRFMHFARTVSNTHDTHNDTVTATQHDQRTVAEADSLTIMRCDGMGCVCVVSFTWICRLACPTFTRSCPSPHRCPRS